MGFRRKLVVSSPLDQIDKQRVLRDARAAWPMLALAAGPDAYPRHAVFAAPDPTEALYATAAGFEQAQEANWKLEDELPGWSARHAGVTFAFIDADCRGGACLYEGFVCCEGRILVQREPAERAHVALLSRVGICIDGAFAPLSRGYFSIVA